MTILFFMSLLWAINVYILNGQLCTTPSGGIGQCISIDDCEPLSKLAEDPNITLQQFQLLQSSKCGSSKWPALTVCCPPECTTPDGKAGTCETLDYCPHLADRLREPVSQENRLYVQMSKCDKPGPKNMCCGPAPVSVTTTSIPPDPSTDCCGYDSTFGNNSTMRRTEIECNEVLKSPVLPLSTHRFESEEVILGEFPYMVALGYEKQNGIQFICGGAIISTEYVLTSARCIDTFEAKPMLVRLGAIDVSDTKWNNETDVPIYDYIVHPNFTKSQMYNDLGLVRLSPPLNFSLNVQAVCLETKQDDPKQTLTVIGWRQASNSTAQKSKVLLKTNAIAVSLSECSKTFNRGIYRMLARGLVPEMLCAAHPTGSLDANACKVIVGGPILESTVDGQYRLVGISSFGKTCDRGVYTRVSSYLDWIESIVWR